MLYIFSFLFLFFLTNKKKKKVVTNNYTNISFLCSKPNILEHKVHQHIVQTYISFVPIIMMCIENEARLKKYLKNAKHILITSDSYLATTL